MGLAASRISGVGCQTDGVCSQTGAGPQAITQVGWVDDVVGVILLDQYLYFRQVG